MYKWQLFTFLWGIAFGTSIVIGDLCDYNDLMFFFIGA